MENETYCGKICTDCPHREALNCPGCKQGPGGLFAKCKIAQCCQDKRHDTCGTCTSWSFCGLRNGRDQEPVWRRQKAEQMMLQQQESRQHAPVMARWLTFLFWLFIPQIIAGIMTNDNVVKAFPGLEAPGTILTVACTILYSIGLWQMRSVNRTYGKAAICLWIMSAGNAMTLLTLRLMLQNGQMDNGLLFLQVVVALALMGVSLYAICLEYKTHADVVEPVDAVLADQWRKLWKWNIWSIGGTVALLLLGLISMMLSAVLALLVALMVLVLSIVMIVLSILKLVYLYRTAQRFRELCDS